MSLAFRVLSEAGKSWAVGFRKVAARKKGRLRPSPASPAARGAYKTSSFPGCGWRVGAVQLPGGGVAFEKRAALFGLGATIVPVVIGARLGWAVDFEAALHWETQVGQRTWEGGEGRCAFALYSEPFLARLPLFKGDRTEQKIPQRLLPKTDYVTKETFGQIEDGVGIRADSQDLKNRLCLDSFEAL